jgi:hypothetical protein
MPPNRATDLAAAKSSSAAFATKFGEDPVAALKAKGLDISSAEAARLVQKVNDIRARPGRAGAAATDVEVTVGVKVKF